MRRRVGVFGGTFDPPHVGHLVAACAARHQLGLDEVLLMVAGQPWQKQHRPDLAPATVRFGLVSAAVAGHDALVASDLEIRREGPSYTIDTLEALAVARPEDDLVLVVGSDAAAGLASWHRADEVAAAVTIAVIDRPGAPMPDVGTALLCERVEMAPLDISSSDIRARCRDGRPVDFLVPDGVCAEMRRLHLYGLGA